MCLSCPLPFISYFGPPPPPPVFLSCLSGPAGGLYWRVLGLGEVAPFLSLGSPEAIKSSGEEAGDLLVPRSPLVMI